MVIRLTGLLIPNEFTCNYEIGCNSIRKGKELDFNNDVDKKCFLVNTLLKSSFSSLIGGTKVPLPSFILLCVLPMLLSCFLFDIRGLWSKQRNKCHL